MSKKELILEKSLDLFIEKGFHSTSTKMISDATGVSNGAIFHHFETKECIARALYMDIKQRLRDSLCEAMPKDSAFRQFMHAYWMQMITWSINHPKEKEFLNIFSNNPMIKSCMMDKRKMYGFLILRIEKAIEQKDIIIDDIEYFMFNFNAVTDGVLNYLKLRPEKNTEDFLEKTFSLYWRSIVNF